MIFEYGIKNFFSFKEGATISFRLPTSCPEHISQGRNTSTVLCVKGANGSGKTQVLKGLSFLAHFCAASFNDKPEDGIAISSFYGNSEPIEFYIEFSIEDIEYRFEASLTDSEIIREALYRKKSKRVIAFERNGNTIATRTSDFRGVDQLKLRSNASIISTAHQYELQEFSSIHRFFQNIVANVGYAGLNQNLVSINVASKFFNDSPKVFDFVKQFIRKCDTGISDIKIREREVEPGKTEFYPVFIHKTNGKEKTISRIYESSGTKCLYSLLGLYKASLELGGVLCLDEFDINLHPDILPKLIDLYTNFESNPNNAQLIFSTHNSEILDLLGRYRTYLVNKEDNESYAYRLDEIPGDVLRNDRPISPAYREGKIGGVPKI